ncbi:MAG: SUF system NifU family Fe-S cluster assembly protein [Candidatus Omnitrophota bacterium]|nr:SUF system NifU family Fe-S cluster assembly protein [Candidatus Omnitrophota bacterium]MDZ4241765.1 SUF system NifU family Fe-S cluster assembly protein [Candidatus Omnitrophota bacterium]
MSNDLNELYQQVILEHNKKPRNFRKIEHPTHSAEGYNPLCGDHLNVYLTVNEDRVISDIAFLGDGCAISRASASMMTEHLKGKRIDEAAKIFEQFHKLIIGELKPEHGPNTLGKLSIFSNIWHFPARVKCASLAWHTVKGALNKEKTISTE